MIRFRKIIRESDTDDSLTIEVCEFPEEPGAFIGAELVIQEGTGASALGVEIDKLDEIIVALTNARAAAVLVLQQRDFAAGGLVGP